MTEALAIPAVAAEEIEQPREPEARGNTKTKLITAGVLGVIGVAAAYAESRGIIRPDWPIPMHSFKHPWVGYYSAWAASRLRRPNAAAVAAGAAGDMAAESAQDMIHNPSHYPLHWLELHDKHRVDGTEDNIADWALCMGGTALFLAQNNNLAAWAKVQLSRRLVSNQEAAASIE